MNTLLLKIMQSALNNPTPPTVAIICPLLGKKDPAFVKYHNYDDMDFFQLNVTLFFQSYWRDNNSFGN